MADEKKDFKKEDNKKERKFEKKPEAGDRDIYDKAYEDFKPLWWLLGIPILLGFFVTNWNGVLVDLEDVNVRDSETGEIVKRERLIRFPSGGIIPGIEVINKEDAYVRGGPASPPLGQQKKYEIAIVDHGPISAYSERWWRLDYKNAPDGWVAESSITAYVWLYRTLHIFPIVWIFLKPIFWILSGIFLILLLYVYSALKAARYEAKKRLEPDAHNMPHIIVGKENLSKGEEEISPMQEKQSNARWMHILQLLESYNQNDWRQAIIEADIILEEMLEKMGYDGSTIGDKLKNVEASDFLTLNQAWEAHKIRNRIAHSGSEFKISQDESRRVIGLYQEVFEEFYFI